MSTISQLETFMVNALESSPLIPLGVNILRLADTLDKEGAVQGTSNIVVSYSGSSSNLKNREPYVIEKSYSFKVTVTAQDYLSTSAHDFALMLKEGVLRTLINQVPFVEGVQVVEPYYSTDDTFEGITENSQYVYGITFRLTGEEVYPPVSMDPCVRRGNCKAIWPPEGFVESVPPGAFVTDDGRLWEVASENDCGEFVLGAYVAENGDIVLKGDDSILIPCEEKENWSLETTSFITTEDGKLEVWLKDENGNQIEQIFYTNTGLKVPRVLLQLWRSSLNGPAKFRSSLSCQAFSGITHVSTYAVVDVIFAQVYDNPLVSDKFTEVPGGSLLMVNPEVKVCVGDTQMVQVVESTLNSPGWVDERAIIIEDKENLAPAKYAYLDGAAETSGYQNPGNDKTVGRSKYDGSSGNQPSGRG